MKHDAYLALLALSCAVFVYAAIGRHKPKTMELVPAGLFLWVLAVFLAAAGWL